MSVCLSVCLSVGLCPSLGRLSVCVLGSAVCLCFSVSIRMDSGGVADPQLEGRPLAFRRRARVAPRGGVCLSWAGLGGAVGHASSACPDTAPVLLIREQGNAARPIRAKKIKI